MHNSPSTLNNILNYLLRNYPASLKQRALLEFLKLPVPPTRGGASAMINSVFEGISGNAHMRAWEVAKYKLYPSLYPSKSRAKSAYNSQSTSLLGFLIKTALVLGLGFYIWQHYYSTTEPEIRLIPLQSTDGRTINAQILTLTKEKALIRREDGQTFDLPLDRLTPESKRLVEKYHAAKSARSDP